MKPAVFLDRDGTVLEEAGYLDRLERLVFFPYAIDAIRLLNHAGFAVVIITNQSGVGRGLYEEEFVHRAHAVVDERVKAGGGRIDGFYYCPHHPTAEIERYRKDCDCRKPGPGMLRAAAVALDAGGPGGRRQGHSRAHRLWAVERDIAAPQRRADVHC